MISAAWNGEAVQAKFRSGGQVFEYELPDRNLMDPGLILYLDSGVAIKTVPPLGCMKEGVAIPDIRL